MRRLVGLLIVVLMVVALTTPVLAVSRLTTVELEGDIEWVSQLGGPAGETVIDVQGQGRIYGTIESSSTLLEIRQSHELTFTSAPDTILTPLTVISGARVNGSNMYVTQVQPDPGQSGYIAMDFMAGIDQFTTMMVGTEVMMPQGTFHLYVSLFDKDTKSKVKDFMKVVGRAYLLDMVEIKPINE